MAKYYHHHKINTVACIWANEKTIDVILTAFEGPYRNREATFEIRGIPNTDTITLTPSDGLIELIDGVKIRVLAPKKSKGDRVPMEYEISENYDISFKDY